MELGYRRMKEELRLGHHEGRSWRGFHYPACLVILAFGFLTLEQRRARRGDHGRAKGGRRADVITLPAIRRVLQRPLAPISRHDCTYCRPWLARDSRKVTEEH